MIRGEVRLKNLKIIMTNGFSFALVLMVVESEVVYTCIGAELKLRAKTNRESRDALYGI